MAPVLRAPPLALPVEEPVVCSIVLQPDASAITATNEQSATGRVREGLPSRAVISDVITSTPCCLLFDLGEIGDQRGLVDGGAAPGALPIADHQINEAAISPSPSRLKFALKHFPLVRGHGTREI